MHRPNRYIYEEPDTDSFDDGWDTMCIVTWGAVVTLVSCYWFWALFD